MGGVLYDKLEIKDLSGEEDCNVTLHTSVIKSFLTVRRAKANQYIKMNEPSSREDRSRRVFSHSPESSSLATTKKQCLHKILGFGMLTEWKARPKGPASDIGTTG